jgi:TRAP-type C4-dicarboxylate transport system substrate-binding protein
MKTATRFLALTGVVVLAAVLLVSSAVTAGTITIKYSDSDPPGGVRTNFVKNVWFPEMVKQTGGKIAFQDYWGGAMVTAPESLKAIGDNVTNMGFVFAEFYSKQLPLHQGFKLFPVGPGGWQAQRWFYDKVYSEIPEFSAELKKYNQMPLLATAGLPGAFCSTKPITKVDDLKGRKWRASSRWVLAFLKNAGATPVSVPWADVYMALQTGTIDGVLTNYDGAAMTKLDEAGPNILVAKELWWATPFLHLVNLDFWKGLPKDVQDGILKASATASEQFGKSFDEAFDQIVAAEKKAGRKVNIMPADELAKWEQAAGAQEQAKIWVKELQDGGYKNADQILAKLTALHKEAMAKDKK